MTSPNIKIQPGTENCYGKLLNPSVSNISYYPVATRKISRRITVLNRQKEMVQLMNILKSKNKVIIS